MQASGHARWVERLVAELNIELCSGDAAEIRSKRVRKPRFRYTGRIVDTGAQLETTGITPTLREVRVS